LTRKHQLGKGFALPKRAVPDCPEESVPGQSPGQPAGEPVTGHIVCHSSRSDAEEIPRNMISKKERIPGCLGLLEGDT
jgi:hypothetical protein